MFRLMDMTTTRDSVEEGGIGHTIDSVVISRGPLFAVPCLHEVRYTCPGSIMGIKHRVIVFIRPKAFVWLLFYSMDFFFSLGSGLKGEYGMMNFPLRQVYQLFFLGWGFVF